LAKLPWSNSHAAFITSSRPTHRQIPQHHLDAFTVGKAHAEAFAPLGIVHGDLHSTLRQAQPAHAMRETRRSEPDLGDLQPPSLFEQEILFGNLQSIELDFAMPAMLLRPHDGYPPDDPPAGLILVEHERGQPRTRIIRRPGDDDKMCSLLRTGDEPLPAMKHIAIADLLRRGPDH